MRRAFPTLPLVVGLLAGLIAACGHKIGDSCSVSSDCSSDGTRVCDTFSPGGSCTIEGCDFGSCPEEAVCVRFFPAQNSNTCTKTCTDSEVCAIGDECVPRCSTTNLCEPDEVCTVGGKCAPRSIELRFCMPTCGDDGDCRDSYECRTLDVMKRHGGEPVPDPEATEVDDSPQPFCGGRKPCIRDIDCDVGDVCEFATHLCEAAASKPSSN